MAEYRFDQIVINITEKKKPVEEDKYTYIGLEHLDSQNLKVSRWGSDIAPKGEKLVMKKGDVLFGKRRAYQKKVAISPFDGIFSAHGMVLRPNEEIIDKNFFPLFISSDYFLDAAIKISVGSLSPTINWRDLKELKFQLPDLDKQKKLADMLWSINRTLLRYKELLNKTDELVKSQFIEMFGNVFAEETPWEKVPFDEAVIDATKHGTKIQKENYLPTGSFPIYDQGQECITGYWNDADGLYKEVPAIIFGDHTRILKYADQPFFLGADGVKLLKAKRKDLDYLFLLYELRTANIPNTGYNRHFKLLKELSISIPPMELQEQFAAFVQQSDKSKFELEQTLSELNATYKRIIEENLG